MHLVHWISYALILSQLCVNIWPNIGDCLSIMIFFTAQGEFDIEKAVAMEQIK